MNNKPIKVNGEYFESVAEACNKYNKKYHLVVKRIKRLKWTIEEALEIEPRNQIKVKNKTFKSLKQAADHYSMSHNTVKRRLSRGWSID